MKSIEQQLVRADCLGAVTQRIGFAIWQIQELEGAAAQYFVLTVQARRGMGTEAGNLLLDKARRKTFGATIHELAKAGILSTDLEARFARLLAERNWLVHKSRSHSRGAIDSDAVIHQLVSRVTSMANEATQLLREIGLLAEAHVKRYGIAEEEIAEAANRLLADWHASHEL
jgi:hypothetical protein